MATEPRPCLASSERTIRNLKDEILRLKLTLRDREQQIESFSQNKSKQRTTNLNETERDIIASLMETNNKLQNEIQALQDQQSKNIEQKQECLKDAECQTTLDRFNIDELFQASLKLRRQKQAQKRSSQNEPANVVPSQAHMNYMQEDEKMVLDKLFKINGSLTTVRDKLRAKRGL